MMRIKNHPRREPPENTIPLINVVFLMLIFFLFAGSLARDDAKKIEPPLNIVEDETIRSTGALVVNMDGKTFAGEAEVSVAEWLESRVPAGGDEGDALKVAADGALGADHLEKVLAELKSSGQTNIVLITRRGTK